MDPLKFAGGVTMTFLKRACKLVLMAVLSTAAGVACAAEADQFEAARRMIAEGNAACVVIRSGRIFRESGRGVSPLLEFHDHREAGCLRGATIVDKVIGRAAAMIAISGGATRVHGETMSEDARTLLESRGVTISYGTLVPRILNADRSDLCPLEKSVEGIDDPEQALAALRKRIEELKNGK